MFAIIDRSARLNNDTLEVFGVVPKSKVNACEELVYGIIVHSPYGDVMVNFFRNRRNVLIYRAFTTISGHTTLFELKGWASAIRHTMKIRFQMF